MRWKNILLICLLVAIPAAHAGADLEREARLKAEIVDAILDGEPVDLPREGGNFLGIHTETDGEAKGAVLILHGRGLHPDWLDTIQPLRVGLVGHGWNTLSIQLPVLEKSAKYNDYLPLFPEALPRIDAAIAYLREQGNERIVLLAHSCGGHMANHWLHKRSAEQLAELAGFIGVGLGATDYKQPMQETFALAKFKGPILDLYGAADYPAVLRMAPERLGQIHAAGNPKSAQVQVPAADHYFTGKGEALVEAVADWLATL